MDNQHKKISGYRDLTQAEIDAMNRIKSLEAEAGELQTAFMWFVRAVARPADPFQ